MPAFVFDLGGTHLRCALAARDGLHRVTIEKVPTFLDGTPADDVARLVSDRIAAYVDGVSQSGRHDAIVLAFPGPITAGGKALSAPTLYGPKISALPDIGGILQDKTGRKVYVLNDMSAAAWALGSRTTASRFMVVTVSSGIGSKVFDRRHPARVLDQPDFAGEIGHYVVDQSADAPRCDCGALGHLGAIASGRGIERLARRRRADPSLTNEGDIVPAIRRGDAWATEVLSVATQPLASTLLAVILAIGLEKVFVVGGFAQSLGASYATLLNQLILAGLRYPVAVESLKSIVEVCEADAQMCLNGAAEFSTARGLVF